MNVWPHHCDPIVKWPLCLLAKAERQITKQNQRERRFDCQRKSPFHCLPPNAPEGIEYRRPKIVHGS
jgi:hypothetical protein